MNDFQTEPATVYVVSPYTNVDYLRMMAHKDKGLMPQGDKMAWDTAVYTAEKGDSRAFQRGDNSEESLAGRLSRENQIGDSPAKSYNFTATLVSLEIVRSTEVQRSSYEPIKEMSFQVKPLKAVVAHGDLTPTPQSLKVGGQISKNGHKVDIDFSEDNRVQIDTSTGDVAINSNDHYQKEVHYKGTAWQQTILTSDNDTKIVFGLQNISSIQRNGLMEVFKQAFPIGVGYEPRLPASQELSQLFMDNGLRDLNKALKRIDRQEAEAENVFNQRNGDKFSMDLLSKSMRERGLFLEAAAHELPDQSKKLAACAENQLRVALKNMRDEYGVGTPETKQYAESLRDLLAASQDKDHFEEVERLDFEAKRAGLMKTVVDNILRSPHTDNQTMAPELAQGLRKSLISIHIAGGDPALKSFVDDVNRRLQQQELKAPNDTPGQLRHGGIIWTPEGVTRYNGSFELMDK